MSEKLIVDTTGVTPDRSYAACLRQCEALELIEIVKHGRQDYGRITQDGMNVFCCLLQIAHNSSHPENRLKES